MQFPDSAPRLLRPCHEFDAEKPGFKGFVHIAHWPSLIAPSADADGVRNVMVIVHGLGEHTQRFVHFAEWFRELPVDLWAFDHLGHGRTSGTRGVAAGVEALADNLDWVLGQVFRFYGADRDGNAIAEAGSDASPRRRVRLTLYGHSMGGAVSMSYMIGRSTPPTRALAGAILSAPALSVTLNAAARVKRVFGKLLSSMRLGDTVFSAGGLWQGISSDPAQAELYHLDPLVHSLISASLGLSLINFGDTVVNEANVARLPCPILVYHGTKDPLVPISASQKFLSVVAAVNGRSGESEKKDVKFEEFDGAFHEIHHEKQVYQDKCKKLIVDWMNEKTLA